MAPYGNLIIRRSADRGALHRLHVAGSGFSVGRAIPNGFKVAPQVCLNTLLATNRVPIEDATVATDIEWQLREHIPIGKQYRRLSDRMRVRRRSFRFHGAAEFGLALLRQHVNVHVGQ